MLLNTTGDANTAVGTKALYQIQPELIILLPEPSHCLPIPREQKIQQLEKCFKCKY